ncbi:MAG: cupin domain-containing protein [Steroidobacteraceae bacterium]
MNYQPINALAVAELHRTIYPAPFAKVVAGRGKRRLGDHFGLTHFGVNLTQLAPGAASALLHRHSLEDELVYIISGTAVLVIDGEEFSVNSGDCCGFKAGGGKAHHLLNRSDAPVSYLEIGNRAPGADQVEYPNDDLKLATAPDGSRFAAHKDGTPY